MFPLDSSPNNLDWTSLVYSSLNWSLCELKSISLPANSSILPSKLEYCVTAAKDSWCILSSMLSCDLFTAINLNKFVAYSPPLLDNTVSPLTIVLPKNASSVTWANSWTTTTPPSICPTAIFSPAVLESITTYLFPKTKPLVVAPVFLSGFKLFKIFW